MTWREALDDARTQADVEALDERIEAQEQDLLAEAEHLLDEQGDASAAVRPVRALMFVNRFRADIARRLETFDL